MLAKYTASIYLNAKRYMEAFLAAESEFDDNPARVVELAASALLEISLFRDDNPTRIKKGLPVFQHKVPVEAYGYRVDMSVKPHHSPSLNLKDPQERVFAACLPASLSYCHRMFLNVAFSFDRNSDGIVAVEFSGGGDSSATEGGTNAIRNAWKEFHVPTLAYVQQVADQLG